MGISKYAWGKIVPFPAFLGVMRDLWRTLRSLGVAVSGKCWSWKPPSGCKGADLTPLFSYDLHSVVSKHLIGISSSQRDRKHSLCFRGGNRNIEITRKKTPLIGINIQGSRWSATILRCFGFLYISKFYARRTLSWESRSSCTGKNWW